MSGIKDAIKIIDKTPEEIEQIKSDVKGIGLPEETVTVIINGLSLIIWLPKLLLEQKVTIARLKELLFGKGQRKSKSKASKGVTIHLIFTKTLVALCDGNSQEQICDIEFKRACGGVLKINTLPVAVLTTIIPSFLGG